MRISEVASPRPNAHIILVAISVFFTFFVHVALSQTLRSVPFGAYVAGGAVTASAVQPDGKIVIAGSFVAVAGVPRENIARLNADGTVDPAFDPGADGVVAALAIDGNVLYVGGNFSNIAGQPRYGLGAIDLATGQTTSWAPVVGPLTAAISAIGIAPDGSIIVGGEFSQIGGAPRVNLAALASSDGAALTDWRADVDGIVSVVTVNENIVYVAGQFNTVAGVERYDLAALDLATAAPTAWNPGANSQINYIRAVSMFGNNVFIAGSFSLIGNVNRTSLAEIDADTGNVTSWNANLETDVSTMLRSGDTLYVCESLVSQFPGSLFTVDATSGSRLGFAVGVDSGVLSIAVTDTTVFAGGIFTHANDVLTGGLARIDLATTQPAVSQLAGQIGSVAVLESESDGSVIAGGSFTAIGDVERINIARIVADGTVDAFWNPGQGSDGTVTAIKEAGGIVYVAGSFENLGGHFRPGLAAIDRSTGVATPWQPTPDGQVVAIATNGQTVYVGGSFQHVGNSTRANVAALDATSGLALTWDPSPDNQVFSLATADEKVWITGRFETIGGASRRYLASVDMTSGIATAWTPEPDQPVDAVAVGGGAIFVGGEFSEIAGEPRPFAAAFNRVDGSLSSWNPNANIESGPVTALAIYGSDVYEVGRFVGDAGSYSAGVRAYDAEFGLPLGWSLNVDNQLPPDYDFYPTVYSVAFGSAGVIVGGLFDTTLHLTRMSLAAFVPPDAIFNDGFN